MRFLLQGNDYGRIETVILEGSRGQNRKSLYFKMIYRTFGGEKERNQTF